MRIGQYHHTKRGKALAILVALALALPLGGGLAFADDGDAAKVFINGVVYTVEGKDWDKNPQECVAVSADGKILFVGSVEGAEAYIGDDTEVIDLDGNIVLPGFIDGHCHVPGATLTELFEIYLYESLTKEQTLADIAAFIEENPDLSAYWGNGYSVSIGGDPRGPKAEWLDEICADKPIILGSNDGHNMWLNSKALEMNGITPDTAVPAGGSIPVDPSTGKLWGSLTDASSVITMEQDDFSEAQQIEAIAYYQELMHGWGYTGVMCIAPHMIDTDLYKKFEDSGDLALRLNLAVEMSYEDGDIEETIKEARAWKDSLKDSKLMKVSTVKYFADGVVEGMTGYL